MPLGFIIMQIGNPELDDVASKAFVPALNACGLEAKRVDKHNKGGLLKSEIVSFIQDADIIIADLTNERPNCYLEVGYAMGMDKHKNLILTVREDHFSDNSEHVVGGPKVHFDLAGYDILPWRPTDMERLRIELQKRIRRRLHSIQESLANEEETRTESDWFDEQRKIADDGMRKAGRTAFMEAAFRLAGHNRFSRSEINIAARSAQIETFGWPIAPYVSEEPFRPRPRSDGVSAEIVHPHFQSYDYWAIRTNADFYWRGSLFEDERNAQAIFLDTRIVRVTETLLYCYKLYTGLGLERQRVVSVEIGHFGIAGRILSATTGAYTVLRPFTCSERGTSVSDTVRLDQIEDDLVARVKKFTMPFFELFDFFVPTDSVYEKIVNNFVAGRT